MQPAVKLFNGTHTIQNRETGEHRTFRIRTQPDDAKFAPGARIVGILTGPDNTSDYKQFGFVTDDGINVWRKYRGADKRSAYEWYATMLWALGTDPASAWHEKYTILTEGRCCRCNRKLTEPTSIRTGIGPVCAGRE
jgi:hypothetical protein